MLEWFWSTLAYFGLYYKNAKIIFLGLDNAGKTTLMYVLRDDKVTQHIPTQHPITEEVVVGKIKFRAFDLGGHQVARQIWKNYYQKVDAVVFLVDSIDKARFFEVKQELKLLLDDSQLKNVPFLILGNKIDQSRAAGEEELKNEIGLKFLTTGKTGNITALERPIELFMCSVIRKIGYGDGFRWLAQFL
mmetsp:Transcript_24071/g.48608  ORF Transcript_24071/g.48608 Transcript_24071/m.48608 type:complete len:189 (+) Transcript_24071:80-646(+)